MGAPEIVHLEQGSQEWLALRRTKRCASETPIVMSLSPWGTWNSLKATKAGRDAVETSAMRHGKINEERARQAFSFEFGGGGSLLPVVVIDGPWLASIDGAYDDLSEIVEIKCPVKGRASSTWAAAARGEVEPHYLAQVQHQLMVTRAKLAHFFVHDCETGMGVRVRVEPDPAAWEEIARAWDAYEAWAAKDVPMPSREARIATYRRSAPPPEAQQPAPPEADKAARAWADAKRALDAAKAAEEQARKALLSAVEPIRNGQQTVEIAGVEVAWSSRAGSVDYKAIPELKGVNLEAYRKPSTAVCTITIKEK